VSEHPVVGPLFSPHLLEESILRKLQRWLPGYLTIACELNGVEEGIEAITSWGLQDEDDDKWPEQGLPALVVVAGRTIGEPKKHSKGMYRAVWPISIGVAIAASNGVLARKYAQVYGAAIRGVILQGRSQGEEGQTAEWLGDEPGIIAVEQRRTIASNANAFAITKDDVVSWRMGSGSDKPPIPDTWPEVTETDAETEIQ
jgi:hypothetical protein